MRAILDRIKDLLYSGEPIYKNEPKHAVKVLYMPSQDKVIVWNWDKLAKDAQAHYVSIIMEDEGL